MDGSTVKANPGKRLKRSREVRLQLSTNGVQLKGKSHFALLGSAGRIWWITCLWKGSSAATGAGRDPAGRLRV